MGLASRMFCLYTTKFLIFDLEAILQLFLFFYFVMVTSDDLLIYCGDFEL